MPATARARISTDLLHLLLGLPKKVEIIDVVCGYTFGRPRAFYIVMKNVPVDDHVKDVIINRTHEKEATFSAL